MKYRVTIGVDVPAHATVDVEASSLDTMTAQINQRVDDRGFKFQPHLGLEFQNGHRLVEVVDLETGEIVLQDVPLGAVALDAGLSLQLAVSAMRQSRAGPATLAEMVSALKQAVPDISETEIHALGRLLIGYRAPDARHD
jgi:hypothetical protein